MASHLLLESGDRIELEDGTGTLLLELQPVVTGDYLVQEVDGTSRFTLEDGTGFILLEHAGPTPPTPEPSVDGSISVRRRILGRTWRTGIEDDDAIALAIALRAVRKRTVSRD